MNEIALKIIKMLGEELQIEKEKNEELRQQLTEKQRELDYINESRIEAKWLDNADSYICSNCGYECNNPNKNKYGSGTCPNCGAKMRGRK